MQHNTKPSDGMSDGERDASDVVSEDIIEQGQKPLDHSRTLLIISYDFPPRAVRAAVRTANVAKYLVANGWRVIVVCSPPDGTVQRDEVWASQLEQLGVHIIRTKALKRVEMLADGSINMQSPLLRKFSRWFSQWRRQPDVFVSWRKEALKAIENILSEYSVNMLLAAAPPFSNLTLVQEVAEAHLMPFAIDYGDTWLDNPLHSYPTPMHRNASAAMEESLLRKAAMIFTPTRRTKEDLLRRFRFLTHEEILIVPHGFDADEFVVKPRAVHEHCVITAYQDFHRDSSPKYLLKAIRLLLQKRPELASKLQLHLVGSVREKHRALVRKWKLQNNVRISLFCDRPRAIELLVQSDVLCYVSAYDNIASSAIIGDFIGAEKPLLLSAPAGTLVSSAKEVAPVFHAPYDNHKEIYAQLVHILEAHQSSKLSAKIGKVQHAKVEQYSYAKNMKEVSRVLGMNMKM